MDVSAGQVAREYWMSSEGGLNVSRGGLTWEGRVDESGGGREVNGVGMQLRREGREGVMGGNVGYGNKRDKEGSCREIDDSGWVRQLERDEGQQKGVNVGRIDGNGGGKGFRWLE